ncbi:hypothetical protein [Sphingomonas sanguinis]|uniref:hypothetical protein n=1 Tax=Sphingomonas sanguinis TaxID=33051 RepID=UPI003017757C
MTPDAVQALKIKLDHDLKQARPEVGIRFGVDAYREFSKAGWFKPMPFSALGTGAFPIDLPTYKGHYAGCDPNAPDEDAEVGK